MVLNPGLKIKHEYAHRITWFKDSPFPGEPDCICSLCGELIPEEDVPIRMWTEKHKPALEARFHEDCFKKVVDS